MHPRALVLLDQISQRLTEQAGNRELRESVALMEAKCEQLQEDLANARFVVIGYVPS
jgi:uncharacterized protein (DUF2164 family)